jgi:hypothetical protein
LLFIIYENHLPPAINTLSEPIIFADVTSCHNFDDFSRMPYIALTHMIYWFAAEKLA